GGFVQPWLTGSRPQNEDVMTAIATAALAYVRGGYDVVVDCVIGPWHLAPIAEAAAAANVAFDVVFLLPHADAAVARAQARPGDQLRDEGPIPDLHRQFSQLPGWERPRLASSRPPDAEAP